MTDKWTHAEVEALGKLPHDGRVKMRLGERLECIWCGDDTSELRWAGESNGRGKPCDPACEECCPGFSTGGCGDPVMDGPDFDDLPIAQKGASK